MRTTTNNLGTVYYPDTICFAFNPVYVKLTDFPGTHVVTTLSDEAGTSYSYEEMAYSDTVVINISRGLQMFFDVYNIVEKRAVAITVTIEEYDGYYGTDPVDTFTFTTTAIWGIIQPGERFGVDHTIRWFKNFPQYVSVFDGTTFSDVLMKSSGLSTFTFDYTFDYTFQYAGDLGIDYTEDDSTAGIFLRWIDRHGRLQYWLFEIGVEEIKNDDGGQMLTFNYVDVSGNSFRSLKRQQYFFSENTHYLCAPSVTQDEFLLLVSILTSPVIDMYYVDADGNDQWIPVIIDTQTIKRQITVLQDFEFKICLPNTNAQML